MKPTAAAATYSGSTSEIAALRRAGSVRAHKPCFVPPASARHGPRTRPNDIDGTSMLLKRHEWDIHVVSGLASVPVRSRPPGLAGLGRLARRWAGQAFGGNSLCAISQAVSAET